MTYYSVIGILLIGLPTLTEAYSYPYYNCAKPSNLETYDRGSLCATPSNPLALAPEATWQLLQVSRSVEIEGYSCDVCKSLFQGYYGVWGHTKLGGPPSLCPEKNAALGYLKFELTQHSADLAQQLKREHCQRGTQDTGITPHHLRGSKYMLTRGTLTWFLPVNL